MNYGAEVVGGPNLLFPTTTLASALSVALRATIITKATLTMRHKMLKKSWNENNAYEEFEDGNLRFLCSGFKRRKIKMEKT